MMKIVNGILIVLFFASCASGRIDCPEVKTVKLKRSHGKSAHIFAESAPVENTVTTRSNRSTLKTISHVSVEEWDCPRPTGKRYLPKSVKQNIRANWRKMQREETNDE